MSNDEYEELLQLRAEHDHNVKLSGKYEELSKQHERVMVLLEAPALKTPTFVDSPATKARIEHLEKDLVATSNAFSTQLERAEQAIDSHEKTIVRLATLRTVVGAYLTNTNEKTFEALTRAFNETA